MKKLDKKFTINENIYKKLFKNSGLQGFTDDEKQEVVEKVIDYLYLKCSNLSVLSQEKIGMTMVRLRAIDLIRYKQRTRKILGKQGAYLQKTSRDDDPAIKAIVNELRVSLIRAIINNLTLQERQAIYFRFYEAQTLQSIANFLGVSINKSHNIIRQALTKLQRQLADYSDFNPEELGAICSLKLFQSEDIKTKNIPKNKNNSDKSNDTNT